MSFVTFVVHGIPAPQGSKAPWGGESNPRTRPWRAAVTAEAAQAMGDRPFLDGPLYLTVSFYFPRPKSHYRTGKLSRVPKGSAPCLHAQKPDLDKLMRAIGDALTGVVYRDDSMIAGARLTKSWAEKGSVKISVEEMAP